MRPIHRVFWMDGDPNIYHRNAEILIRHDFELNTAQDGKIAWSEAGVHSQVISPVRLSPFILANYWLKELRTQRRTRRKRAGARITGIEPTASRCPSL